MTVRARQRHGVLDGLGRRGGGSLGCSSITQHHHNIITIITSDTTYFLMHPQRMSRGIMHICNHTEGTEVHAYVQSE